MIATLCIAGFLAVLMAERWAGRAARQGAGRKILVDTLANVTYASVVEPDGPARGTMKGVDHGGC
jgi:hypothetical protein